VGRREFEGLYAALYLSRSENILCKDFICTRKEGGHRNKKCGSHKKLLAKTGEWHFTPL
jgi:hypothetical protein